MASGDVTWANEAARRSRHKKRARPTTDRPRGRAWLSSCRDPVAGIDVDVADPRNRQLRRVPIRIGPNDGLARESRVRPAQQPQIGKWTLDTPPCLCASAHLSPELPTARSAATRLSASRLRPARPRRQCSIPGQQHRGLQQRCSGLARSAAMPAKQVSSSPLTSPIAIRVAACSPSWAQIANSGTFAASSR